MRRGWILLLLVVVCGCSRAWYRRSADKETYGIVNERRNELVWPIANNVIDPPPASRLHDPFDPDYPPLPPDDPTASQYLRRVNGMRNSRHFHDDGDAPFIEDPAWANCLELDKDGKLVLTPERAVELGVLHSRDYQTAREQLYLAGLALSLNRFDFAVHWYGTNGTFFDHFGSSDTEINTLTTNTDFGFTKNFAAGGQLIFDVANSFVFTFSGINQTTTTSTIGVTLTQPLLRGFGRRVRLEALTEGERTVLYGVRDYARFRKQFYVELTTANSGGYLGLLFQLQNIINQQENLRSQGENLRLNEALLASGSVSIIQVDQAFQSYQQAKLSVLQAQTSLEASLDRYKLTIGLPPGLPVRVDDALLEQFQLQDPALEKLQGELDEFFAEYRQFEQPPLVAKLVDGYVRLGGYHARLLKFLDDVDAELRRWEPNVGKGTDDPGQAQRERATFESLRRQLPELRADVKALGAAQNKAAADLTEKNRKIDWERLQRHVRQEIAEAAELFVVQAQIRVYLIQLKPIPATLDQATTYARDNRLDLMNERGRVVDAWREVSVTADALRAGLNVTARANVTTPPGGTNPVDFRASASDYNVGLAFDSPLNRLAQRNAYRASQIAYERERRTFMALDDNIQAAVRQDLRTLENERANFSIARQSLISAARQVEAARDRLLLADKANDNPTVTQDVLTALSALLNAKGTLISSWTNYETNRVQLLLDMEALQLDDRGIATDEHHDQSADLFTLPPGFPDRLPGPRKGTPVP